MQNEFVAPLFSTKINSGRRSFFFDVKQTKDSKPYLKITETSVKGEEKKRVNMMVFDSEMTEFKQALEQVFDFMSKR